MLRLGNLNFLRRRPLKQRQLSKRMSFGKVEAAKENRLAKEQSPYLLQHARNPVDWFPWGQEAFEAARSRGRPIFLSVGYSTCHWCHVMEKESFESDQVASVLNDLFVNVKVDRECMPDVDKVYMAFVQATTGSGGWPMSVWLTPDLKPFYGGTYYPPGTLMQIARVIDTKWRQSRGALVENAESVTTALTDALQSSATSASSSDSVVSMETVEMAVEHFKLAFDAEEGGFSREPKFPTPVIFNFLLTRAHFLPADDPLRLEILHMVSHTLHKISMGEYMIISRVGSIDMPQIDSG
eukprot:Partr_v1_DN28543_c0_g2_i5_m72668 putative Spermatogenesis associated 20